MHNVIQWNHFENARFPFSFLKKKHCCLPLAGYQDISRAHARDWRTSFCVRSHNVPLCFTGISNRPSWTRASLLSAVVYSILLLSHLIWDSSRKHFPIRFVFLTWEQTRVTSVVFGTLQTRLYACDYETRMCVNQTSCFGNIKSIVEFKTDDKKSWEKKLKIEL